MTPSYKLVSGYGVLCRWEVEVDEVLELVNYFEYHQDEEQWLFGNVAEYLAGGDGYNYAWTREECYEKIRSIGESEPGAYPPEPKSYEDYCEIMDYDLAEIRRDMCRRAARLLQPQSLRVAA